MKKRNNKTVGGVLNLITTIKLPEPDKKGPISIEEAIYNRRSKRDYLKECISLKEISQLCWCSQGITDERNMFRAVPSAGALYPLEIFIVTTNTEIEQGIYHYSPESHTLSMMEKGDFRQDLARFALGQRAIKIASMNIIIVADYGRTATKYGTRAERYVHMEAGHAAQNIYLQAEGLGLGVVSIGAFYDEDIRRVLSITKELIPLYIIPVGRI